MPLCWFCYEAAHFSSFFSGLGILIYSRWTDDGFYRRVEVAEETEDSFLDVRLKYVKEKLFPPETKDMYDKYVQGKESKSEESSSTESKKSSDSEKSSWKSLHAMHHLWWIFILPVADFKYAEVTLK